MAERSESRIVIRGTGDASRCMLTSLAVALSRALRRGPREAHPHSVTQPTDAKGGAQDF